MRGETLVAPDHAARPERQRPRQSKVGWCLPKYEMALASGAFAVPEVLIDAEGRHRRLCSPESLALLP